jgi:hypothetical protein
VKVLVQFTLVMVNDVQSGKRQMEVADVA